MARVILCDSEDGAEAVAMVTNLQEGTVVALCASCFGPWCRTVADALTPPPSEPAAVSHQDDATAAQEGEATQQTPRPKRLRRPPETASETALPAEAPFPDASLVE